MLSWVQFAGHGMWLFGVAILLALISHASWLAQSTNGSIWELLADRLWASGLGATFISMGLLLTSRRLIEIVIWILVAGLAVGLTAWHLRRLRT